ncbi:MAG: hypothetical protein IT291_06135 [Deltaproteobacteria bacterium]|nr:hypothetical protein [Deltaproteobacteria bacterium]
MKKVNLFQIREILLTAGFLVLYFFVVTPNVVAQGAQVWQQVPIRTKAQKTAGLMGGEGTQNVYSISYAPSNPNAVYNVNDVSQVWKSIDGGSNWAKSHKGFLARGATSVAVSPLNENLVFATGGVMSSALIPQSPADGIYRSTDGGQNWSLVFPGRYYKIFNGGTHVAFANNGTVYAVTLDGKLVKSTDNGSTWTVIWNPGVRMDDIKTHPTTQNILFIVMPSGLWKITDNGSSATPIKIGAGLPKNPASVVIDKQNPNNVYATVYEYKVYKSTNGGLNFSSSSNGMNVSAGKQATSLAISPADGNYLYVYFVNSPQDFFYSHDGGASWQRPVTTDEANADGYVSGSLEHPNTNTGFGWGTGPIVAHPTDKNIAIATGAFYHMKKTTDGGLNWRYSNSGNTGGAAGNGVASFSFDRTNPNRFAIFLVDYGGYITDDNGSTFRPFLIQYYNDNGNYVRSATAGAIDSLSNSQLIISSNGGWDKQTLAQSADNGVTWQFSKDSAGNSMDIGYTFIDFHPQNPNIIYANRYKGVRNAVTKAITWTGLSNRVEAVFAGNGDHVYGFWDKTIYKSIDAGVTWTVHSTITNTETSAGISALSIDPTNENRMYAVAQTNGLYVWNGTTWIKKGAVDGFPKDAFNRYGTVAIAIDPLKPNIIYAANTDQTMGQSNGVFRSTDYGSTWENISYNLGPEINIAALKVNPHNGYIYLGSYHGTWKLPPPYASSDKTPPIAPKGMRVVQ